MKDVTDMQVDIGRAYTAIQKQLGQQVDAIHPADYVRRFCSKLGMTAQDMKVGSTFIINSPSKFSVIQDPLCQCAVETLLLSWRSWACFRRPVVHVGVCMMLELCPLVQRATPCVCASCTELADELRDCGPAFAPTA